MVRWNIMIHYFITWFEYNGHYENCIKQVTWKGWNPNIKSKMGSENHRSSATGDILGTCYLIITKCEKI
jgi:hypothetical protein